MLFTFIELAFELFSFELLPNGSSVLLLSNDVLTASVFDVRPGTMRAMRVKIEIYLDCKINSSNEG